MKIKKACVILKGKTGHYRIWDNNKSFGEKMKYYIFIFITIVLFSTIEVVTKVIGGGIDPIFLSFLRFFISGIIILSINYKQFRNLNIKDTFAIIGLGVSGVTVALGLYHVSLLHLDASKAAVIFSINPIFTSLFAFILYKEKIGLTKIMGIFGGFAGVYILNFGINPIEITSVKGPLLMFAAAFWFAFYIAASKKYVKRYGSFFTTGLAFIIGSLAYIPFIKNWHIENFGEKFIPLAYLVLIGTGVAYLCYFYGLKHVSLTAGTSVFYAKPVIASLLSVIVLGESLNIDFYTGLLIIMISLTLSLFGENILKNVIRINKNS